MKKIVLALITLIIVGMLIPAVSADIILQEELHDWIDTGGRGTTTPSGSQYTGSYLINTLYFTDITKAQTLNYVVYQCDGHVTSLTEGSHPFTYVLNGVTQSGTCHVDLSRNILGAVTSTKISLFFDDFDIGDLTGAQEITLDIVFLNVNKGNTAISNPDNINILPMGKGDVYQILRYAGIPLTTTISSGILWDNEISISEISPSDLQISLKREYDPKYFKSTLIISDNDDNIIYESTENSNVDVVFPAKFVNTVNITSPSGRSYVYPIVIGAPTTNTTVTVYVQNSQTGAAIANANCVIDALVGGDYYPVINRSEPSGIFSVTLQPTGGGIPNPDGYRLIATADGYNNPMPEINFTVDAYTSSIYCYLDPIAGGPLDENKTFIDFFVRDLAANPISGATVNFGGYTLLTNSQGYTVFEIPKNSTYSYTVSKSGYGPLTGTAVIGVEPRYTVNAVLGPSVTPTSPTAIPTATAIHPTPTLTAPTGEPVGNWLEWFAAHFGMILGGGVEIGKIFMWLCFTVPVGVYVGKQAKAGAAGFMAGAGIVTLFFVLIGWVPLWLVVLLALIIGLLYNTSDNGGGR